MPTRAEVIAAKIKQYDAQITGLQSGLIDSAIAKLAVAQLVDASFGGGGGGGGGTSPLAVSDGIDQSIDINAILNRLSNIELAQANTNALIQEILTSTAGVRLDNPPFAQPHKNIVWTQGVDLDSVPINLVAIDLSANRSKAQYGLSYKVQSNQQTNAYIYVNRAYSPINDITIPSALISPQTDYLALGQSGGNIARASVVPNLMPAARYLYLWFIVYSPGVGDILTINTELTLL